MVGNGVRGNDSSSGANPLLGFDNVVVTPHIAGISDRSVEKCWHLSVASVIDLSKGHWPRSYVNRDVKPKWDLTFSTDK